MELLRKSRKHAAIDYDSREIRLVIFEYVRKAPVIRALHTVSIKPDVDASDPVSLGKFLGTAVNRLGLKGAGALMCVGRAQAALKSLTLPRSDANELASMVQFQVSKELPFSADEAVVDYTHGPHWDTDQAVAPPEEGTTVLAAAVRLPVIDAAHQICAEAGLKLQRLGLRPYANLRAVCRCVRTRPVEGLLLVSITADEAEIDVVRGETLQFSRSATVYPPDEAGPEAHDDTRRAATVHRVVTEVTRSLQSFHAVERGAQINACLVAGSTGLEKELAKALSDRLSVRCELFNPAAGFAITSSGDLGGFGAALGLAAGQAAEDLPFDFLNPKRPAEPRDRRKTRSAAIAAAAVVLLAAGVLTAKAFLGNKQALVNRLGGESNDLQRQRKDLAKLQKSVRSAEAWLHAEGDWLGELRHLSRVLPPAQEVYLTSFKCTSAGRASLVGRVKNREDALSFAQKLAAVPGYEIRNKGINPVRRDAYGYGLEFNFDVLISPKVRAESAPAASRPAAANSGPAKSGRGSR